MTSSSVAAPRCSGTARYALACGPDPEQVIGYIAAPSTVLGKGAGLVFHQCNLTRDAGVPAESVYLGRPWRPSKKFPDGQYGNPDAVGMATFIDLPNGRSHCPRRGGPRCGIPIKAVTPRHMLQPEEARFSEFGK